MTAGTLYQYEWYRDGALIESAGNSLTKTAGDTFDFYVRDPGAQKPLEPGTYKHVVKIGGQVILADECVIRQ
ncbi:MAG: hypothetical protein HY741_12895 [Chloroflexi bacterium]|nr:hypothetical protein [Chloroflexota bacterium]